jgi:hypothetical protein
MALYISLQSRRFDAPQHNAPEIGCGLRTELKNAPSAVSSLLLRGKGFVPSAPSQGGAERDRV